MLEYKRSTSELEDALVDISAILNKHGAGELYFGIRPDGEIIGQQVSEATLRKVSQAVGNHIKPVIYPAIEQVVIDDKPCVRVRFEGGNPPYYCRGKAYMRVADESLSMSPEELESSIKRKLEAENPWDSAISDLTVADVDEAALQDYLKKANDAGRIEWKYAGVEDALSRLKLLSGGKLLNTAKVMFSTNPRLELIMATFASEERLTFLNIDNSVDTIIKLVDAGELYVKKAIQWRLEFGNGMKRGEVPEVPMAAVREALLNSFAHRLWGNGQNNEIAIYKDRVEIYNPGTFPEGVSPEDFINGTVQPVQRNPLLAQIMYYSKDIEHFGTGLKRIHDACTEADVRYEFRRGKMGFSVVLYRPKGLILDRVTGKVMGRDKGTFSESFTEDFTERFTEKELQVLALIASDASMTSEEMASALGVTRRTIANRLKALKDLNAIERVGSDTKGSWHIVNFE
jgi:ATP-dependent DNA helicase RecG